jgi:uncharacterized protein YtpQ (UPF0354 family)
MALFDILKKRPPRDQFAVQVMKRLGQRGWSGPMDYDSAAFTLQLGDRENRNTLYLSNCCAEWIKADNTNKPLQIDRLVDSVLNPADLSSFEACADQLLPVVRNRSQLSLEGLLRPELDLSPASLPLAGDLAVGVAVDTPSSLHILTISQLAGWGKNLDDVLPVAIENLRARSPARFARQDAGFYISEYADFYDASRLLLPHLFEQLKLAGDPIALAIDRTAVFVAGSADTQAIAAMCELAKTALEDTVRPIAYLPLRLQNGEWHAVLRNDPDPNLAWMASYHAGWDWAGQKNGLDAAYETQGRDVFVASALAAEIEGNFKFLSTWTYNAVSLLPATDAVAINPSEGAETLVAGWDDVIRICGPFSLEPGVWPERYLFDRAPTPEQIEKLAACGRPEWLPVKAAQA